MNEIFLELNFNLQVKQQHGMNEGAKKYRSLQCTLLDEDCAAY